MAGDAEDSAATGGRPSLGRGEDELRELQAKLQRCLKSYDDDNGRSLPPAEEERAVDILQRMKQCHVTTGILLATQAGRLVKKLSKQGPSTSVSEAAAELVEAWRTIVVQEAAAGGKSKSDGQGNGQASKRIPGNAPGKSSLATSGRKNSAEENDCRGIQRPQLQPEASARLADPLPSPREAREGSGSEDRQGADPDGGGRQVDRGGEEEEREETEEEEGALGAKREFEFKPPQSTGDSVRDRLRDRILQALCQVAGEVRGKDRQRAFCMDVAAVAVAVEWEVWRSHGNSKDLKEYKAKLRSVCFNLKDPRNPDFRRRLLLGEVRPDELPGMSAEAMASDAQQAEVEKMKRRMTEEAVRGQNMQASTDQFKCGKCKQRKTTYFQMQTRSADEPMTTFVTCLNCNNRWKFC